MNTNILLVLILNQDSNNFYSIPMRCSVIILRRTRYYFFKLQIKTMSRIDLIYLIISRSRPDNYYIIYHFQEIENNAYISIIRVIIQENTYNMLIISRP